MSVHILGIESSCDETSAAVLIDGQIISNNTVNQDVHAKYGGVVPELASRAHMANIVPVVHDALHTAGLLPANLDAVAVTQGPGLLGALMVGMSYAKGFAMSLGIPLLTVHHMHAHVLAHFIDKPVPRFPFLCLTVSGGHTQIVIVKDYLDMQVLGETIDDAAGEAYDKTAKMFGIPYPGGPLIDRFAQQGNENAYHFPEPRVPGYDFSFSGLKTSILYFLQKMTATDQDFVSKNKHDLCASVQKTINDILIKKLKLAARATGISEIAIAGGVSANSGLRKKLSEEGEKNGWNTYIPKFAYCTDNAAMIAVSGYYKYLKNDFATLNAKPLARMPE